MKEKIKKIGKIILKILFLFLLFLVVCFFVKIITPHYCMIEHPQPYNPFR